MRTAAKTPALTRRIAYTPRSARGLHMASAAHATRIVGKVWEVGSSDGATIYIVNLDPLSCTCPDWRYRGAETDTACKHIIAAALSAVGC